MRYKVTLNEKDMYYMDWIYSEQIFDYACKQFEQRYIYKKSINPAKGIYEVYIECEKKPKISGFKYADIFTIQAIN